MSKIKDISILIIFIIVSFLLSCDEYSKRNSINEGVIVYHITYLDDEKDNPLITLLPTKMVVKFKNNNTASIIEGFFGTFKIVFVSNLEKGTNMSIFRIMDKKYIYSSDTSSPAIGYKKMKKTNIKNIEGTKKIAGYSCKKAEITYSDNSKSYVYYTDRIGIEQPNNNNPYKHINGVLMEFKVNMVGVNMKFKAKKISTAKIDNSIFDIPKDYKVMTKTDIEKTISGFINSAK